MYYIMEVCNIENNLEEQDIEKKINKNVFILQVSAGLCNRLRAMFSYYQYCKSVNQKLVVIWIPDIQCPGNYKNYFKKINDIIVLDNNNAKHIINCKTCGYHPNYNIKNNPILNLYKDLDIIEPIRKKVKHILSLYRYNLIAVHIRRTDHIGLAKKNNRFTDDNQFVSFINHYNNYNLYIATDCKDTQKKFYKLYKNRIKYIKFIDNNNNHRKTSIEDALIDIYVCKNAHIFKGSDYSSFSSFIEQLRTKKTIRSEEVDVLSNIGHT